MITIAVLLGLLLTTSSQSVIYHVRSADHITNALACLHWLHVPERIDYKQGRCADIHSFTQKCTLDHSFLLPICPADGYHICYGSTSRLLVSSARRSTVGDRTFMVDGPRVWNTLMATSPSLSNFCQQLKTRKPSYR